MIDIFYKTSPFKLIKDAHRIAYDIQKKVEEPPQSAVKYSHLKQLADKHKDKVEYSVEINKNQNELFRKLQKEDLERREKLLNKIQNKLQKKNSLKEQTVKKISEDFHKYNQKVEKKYKQHIVHEIQYERSCEKKSVELTKELMKFHKLEQEKQLKEWERLRNLKTCFLPAKRRTDWRENLKKEFSEKTQKQVQEQLKRNAKKQNPEFQLSIKKRKKRLSVAYESSNNFYTSRHHDFIQTYCTDLDAANKMVEFKEEQFNSNSQRINKWLKKRVQQWEKHKHEVDEQAKVVPQKCIDKLNQTSNSAFRMTMTSSNFHSTSKSWMSRNVHRKAQIKQIQTRRDDRILTKHLQTSRVNKGSDSLNTTMLDLKMKASFNTKEFL